MTTQKPSSTNHKLHATQVAMLLPLISVLLAGQTEAFVATLPFRSTPPRTDKIITKLLFAKNYKIRDFQKGDAVSIQSVLSPKNITVESRLDPEGPLEVDCGSDSAIQESYCQQGDGCFLVVTTNDNDNTKDSISTVVGTAGLIVGTAVSYVSSGASMSMSSNATTTITGAIRRVCATSPTRCQELLSVLEARAAAENVQELIALGYYYPHYDGVPSQYYCRPTPEMLQNLGYEPLETPPAGAYAVPYRKRLAATTPSSRTCSRATTFTKRGSKDRSLAETLLRFQDAFIAGAFALVLVAFLGVAQFMGLDVLSSSNNAGLGSPLSSQELSQMQQQEALKRTDLDGGVARDRHWEELTAEEQQEELALMRIIQGQDVRFK